MVAGLRAVAFASTSPRTASKRFSAYARKTRPSTGSRYCPGVSFELARSSSAAAHSVARTFARSVAFTAEDYRRGRTGQRMFATLAAPRGSVATTGGGSAERTSPRHLLHLFSYLHFGLILSTTPETIDCPRSPESSPLSSLSLPLHPPFPAARMLRRIVGIEAEKGL